ncbi:hypothetical protein RDWZM_000127 [Blomia tropicalis]|uniref:Uncharacterized protein n=1 Tax=Blomia tropicalis TaxID=40697 RepID=A0A9Q0MC96_BLOTA|nr:hypothetical protein BLOT_016131 [Blomia tropicalis]KAJ6221582.1 hypothetical protein RDWZM_000127 [Blomia tropicalis]
MADPKIGVQLDLPRKEQTNQTNPCYSTYRNRSDQLSSFLSDHNVRISSSRTINRLSENDHNHILKQAIIMPRNERKLRKLAYQCPIPVGDGGLGESSMDSSITVPPLSSDLEKNKNINQKDELMSIDINSKFSLIQSNDKKKNETSNHILIRHNNCIHLTPKHDSKKDNLNELPMFYTTSIGSCSNGLSKFCRRYKVFFN